MPVPHPFLDHPGPIAFAHRGGAADHPENTMAAFQAAIDLGYRYVETDVQVTSDGVLVAFHDDTLDRVTDLVGLVAELPWSDLARARLAGSEPIVRFAELLSTFPELRVNIEPKHDAAVVPLIAAIREANALDRVCVGCFDDRRLLAVREAFGSEVCTSLGTREVAALRVGSWGLSPLLGALRRRPGRAAQIPLKERGVPLVEPRLLDAAHELGIQVHAWTINDGPTMDRLLELGVDGIMTDRPRLLREVLQARGQWVGAEPPPPSR